MRYYVYAWRGGPLVHKQERGSRPKLTGDIIYAIAKARVEKKPVAGQGCIKGLITAYKSSPEWDCLSPTTKKGWTPWIDRIDNQFGKIPLRVFDDRCVKGKILDWRDKWADKPRSADIAIQVISRILSYGFARPRPKSPQNDEINSLPCFIVSPLGTGSGVSTFHR